MAGISTTLRTAQRQAAMRDLNLKRDMTSKVHKDFARNYASETQRGTVPVNVPNQLQSSSEIVARFQEKIQKLGMSPKKH